jgi:hypothetical protein
LKICCRCFPTFDLFFSVVLLPIPPCHKPDFLEKKIVLESLAEASYLGYHELWTEVVAMVKEVFVDFESLEKTFFPGKDFPMENGKNPQVPLAYW